VAVPPAVDVQPAPGRWKTVNVERVALIAVHTMTSLMRLEDIIPLIEADPRVQLEYTQVPDLLGHGVEQRLRELEVRVIPWHEATQRSFDLVVSASLHQMELVRARRRFAAPHGAGYNKLWPAWDWAGSDDERPVYGLDRRSLLDDDLRPIFDAIVLPHPDHLVTLARQCREAVPFAVVAGDPCYDRLVMSMADRDLYRSKLGVRDAQVLVAVASTWGLRSLLATQRQLLLRLPAELPFNHRVIATLHPAVWAEHGARQVRAWLRDVREAGVDLIDVGEDWRALVASADVLIADHSSVGVYAAGAGVPVLLSHFPDDEVDPNSIVAELAGLSPRLHPEAPLFGQLTAARQAQPGQAEATDRRVSGVKGMSAQIIRQTLYRLLELTEPPLMARWPRVPVPRLVQDMTSC
jgi:hypothetical protein